MKGECNKMNYITYVRYSYKDMRKENERERKGGG